MTSLIRAEFVKARTLRAFWAVLLLATALAALVTAINLIIDAMDHSLRLDLPGGLAQTESLSTLLIVPVLVGLCAIPAEFRTGTIVPATLIAPRRQRLLMAKTVAYAVMSAVLTAGMLAIVVGALTVASAVKGEALPALDAEGLLFLARFTLVAVGLSLLGLAFGGMVKGQLAAVGIGLVWLLGLEQTVVVLIPASGKWLPQVSGSAFAQGVQTPGMPIWWVSGVVLAVWVMLALAGAAVLLRRRDIA